MGMGAVLNRGGVSYVGTWSVQIGPITDFRLTAHPCCSGFHRPWR